MDLPNIEKYGLDLHCNMILEDYHMRLECLLKMKDIVVNALRKCLSDNNILVTAVESRVKSEESLAGKLELKGNKYKTIDDITDILGARVISFYSDEVDKISALCESIFEIDWENSVDKRKLLKNDSFGYMSIHYICRIPKTLHFDGQYPEMNSIPFELQIRTTLQHAWANMNHDTGYKSAIGIPAEYRRSLYRLAGLLELADDEFGRIRREIIDYRRKVQSLVKGGDFDAVELNTETFKSYLAADPFEKLIARIASINQAEVQYISGLSYLEFLIEPMGMRTLGDVERLKIDYSEAAYQLALHQMSGTDLDIFASTLSIQNLCLCYIVDKGKGVKGVENFLDQMNGYSASNSETAQRIFNRVTQLPIMKQKNIISK